MNKKTAGIKNIGMPALLVGLICLASGIRAEDAQKLLRAGYAFNPQAGQWVDRQGETIKQPAIADLYPEAVLKVTFEALGADPKGAADRQEFFLGKIKNKLASGDYRIDLSRPREDQVEIRAGAIKSPLNKRAGATEPTGKIPNLNIDMVEATLLWDGNAATQHEILLIKGSGSYGGGSRGSYGGGSRGNSGGGKIGGTKTPSNPKRESPSRGIRTPDRGAQTNTRNNTDGGRKTDKGQASSKWWGGGGLFGRGKKDATPTSPGGKPSDSQARGKTTRTELPGGKVVTQTERVNKRTGKISTTTQTTFPNGTKLTQHANGAKTELRRDGTRIHTSPTGRVVTTQSTRSGNTTRITKTVVVNGRTTTIVRNYNQYYYRGGYYNTYMPSIWVPMYPWFYSPWYTPVYYPYWSTWYPYGYWGGYFAPYPNYSSPYFWLTDFIIADYLADRYADSVAARAEQRETEREDRQAQQQAAMSKEIKDQVAEQVKQAMNDYNAKRPATLESVLDTKHIFAVHEELDVTQTESGEECSLSEGDLVRLAAIPSAGEEVATMEVVTAKKDSCPVSTKDHPSTINMSLSTVQEMQNEFIQRLEKGMQKMKEEKDSGHLKIGK